MSKIILCIFIFSIQAASAASFYSKKYTAEEWDKKTDFRDGQRNWLDNMDRRIFSRVGAPSLMNCKIGGRKIPSFEQKERVLVNAFVKVRIQEVYNKKKINIALFSKQGELIHQSFVKIPEPRELVTLDRSHQEGLPIVVNHLNDDSVKTLLMTNYNPAFDGSRESLQLAEVLQMRFNKNGEVIDLNLDLWGRDTQEHEFNQFKSVRSVSCVKDRIPVVFLHGLALNAKVYNGGLNFSASLPEISPEWSFPPVRVDWFKLGQTFPLKEYFESFGRTLIVAERGFGQVITERAAAYRKSIEEQIPKGRFHIIGHSAGALDARYMVHADPEFAKRVVSITSMATPHHGSPLSGESMKFLNGEESVFSEDSYRMRAFRFLFQRIANTPEKWEKFMETGREIVPERMVKFNQEVLNVDGVEYFSMGFKIDYPYQDYTSQSHDEIEGMLKLGIKESDGHCPTASMKWGTYLGTFPGEHLAQTAPLVYQKGGSDLGYGETLLVGRGHIWKRNFKVVLDNLDNLDSK